MATRYFVSDTTASIRFYTGVLGFELVEQWGPAFAIVSKGSNELWLSGPGTSAMKAVINGESPKPGGWNRIVVGVEDLDSALLDFRKNEVTILVEPISGPGGQQVLIADPDGNPVEVFEARS
jgi:catechol 2,3-dioxygenase-like lactoylglutathione lyase family enzyme